jgi:hypothetical protein
VIHDSELDQEVIYFDFFSFEEDTWQPGATATLFETSIPCPV